MERKHRGAMRGNNAPQAPAYYVKRSLAPPRMKGEQNPVPGSGTVIAPCADRPGRLRSRRGGQRLGMVLVVLAATATLPACAPTPRMAGPGQPAAVPGGDAEHGRQAIQRRYGCGACHVIPGVPGAVGKVGPPLLWWADRSMIAGRIPNTPENLVRWIQDPQAIEPGTAMPALGVTEADARDIAAYLFTLR
jgi:cytochrome c